VSDSSRDHDPLAGKQFHSSLVEVQEELSIDDIEELVFFIVLVPVEFAVEDAEAHDAVIDKRQRLVPPAVGALVGQLADILKLQGLVSDASVNGIGHDYI
jgi:hypothetical protein